MLVIAWCAHVGSSAVSSSPRTRQAALRGGGPVVHRRRRDKVENARNQHGLGDANVAQELGSLAQRLFERLGLRGRRLALQHGQIERRRL
eukprot:3575769-Pleurochrysis_carterae.AAC.1